MKKALKHKCFKAFSGGDKRDRTADLLNAIQALSQLSYTPVCGTDKIITVLVLIFNSYFLVCTLLFHFTYSILLFDFYGFCLQLFNYVFEKAEGFVGALCDVGVKVAAVAVKGV